MHHRKQWLIASLPALSLLTMQAADRPPNVILILTDNHGVWTLGCYGNKDIHTPTGKFSEAQPPWTAAAGCRCAARSLLLRQTWPARVMSCSHEVS